MGTINTKIQSRIAGDQLPTVVSYAANSINNVGAFVEYGTITASQITSADTGSLNVLSNNTCGPNGAYIFVENPSTNNNTVNLYGLLQLEQALAEGEGSPIESFATLKPGDSMLVPVSAQQRGVVVATPYGKCDVKYYIADRSGTFGKSSIIITNNGTNFRYFLLDAELGEALPSLGTPTYSVDLKTDIATYYFDYADIVHDKGYILHFVNYSNYQDQKRIYIDSRGRALEYFGLNYGTYSYWEDMLDGKSHLIAYMDGSVAEFKVFDGNSISEKSVTCSGFNVWNDWNYCAADGTFIVEVSDYLGVDGDTAMLAFNPASASPYVLSVLNYKNTQQYVDDCAVYGFGKFIFQSIWDDNIGEYVSFEIKDTRGNTLQSIDASTKNVNSLEWTFYGTNKLQLIAYNGYEDVRIEYLYNYNGTLDNIASTMRTVDLLCTPGNYTSRNFYSYSKWITDSIRPWSYVWNSGQYEPESVVIVYYDVSSYNYSSQVNLLTNNLEFVYMMDGDTDYKSYVYAQNTTKAIWLPNTGGGYYRFYPAKNSFVFNVTDPDTGALQALSFTKNGQKFTTIARDFSALDGESFAAKPVGDYIMYGWYLPSTDKTVYTMFYDQAGKGVRKDSVSIDGSQLYAGVWRMRFNTLVLRSWNYNSPRNWYFNTSANRFVELTAGGNAYNPAKPYYPQHAFNKSTVDNGINDGNILLRPYEYSNISAAYENNNMRLIKGGLETKNVTLTETDGNWNVLLGTDQVVYWYQNPDDSYNLVLKVYDLNLDLKRTIELGVSGWDHTPEMVGERCYFSVLVYDKYKHYMVSSAGVAYMEAYNSYSSETIFNDYYWWDYIY